MSINFFNKLAMVLAIVFFANYTKAQINPSTNYTQDFNSIASGLPIGWTVRTGATATNLGTVATPVLTATTWSLTTGGFSNACSGNAPATSTDATATQAASTDRAISVRQTGTAGTGGDPGAAFVLQLANTNSYTNFQLSFDLMSLAPPAAGRTTTWVVDYGFGASPTSFTPVATIPSPLTTSLATWGVTPVTVNFGNALDNQTGDVWIRIVALTPTTGSGSRPRTAIDDFVLTATNVSCTTPPTVNASSSVSFNCGTDSVTLSATGANTYFWTPGGLTGASVNVAPSAATTYTVVGTDALGCTGSSTVQINHFAGFSLTAYATPPNVCNGANSILYATDTLLGTKSLNQSYCYSNLHSSSGPCITNVTFNTLNNTTSSSCSLPSYSLDTINIATKLKRANTYTLSVAVSPFGYASAWIDFNRNGIFDVSEYTSLIVNTSTGTATVTVPAGASLGYALMRVRSSNNSISSADACTTIAGGETEDYLVHIFDLSPTSINSYTWTPPAGATLSGTFGSSVTAINVTSTGVYTVLASDANGCTKTSTVQLTVGPIICTGVTISGGTPFFCLGASKILTANAIQGGGAYSYQWLNASGTIGNTKSIVVSPTANTTYSVIVSDACSPSNACLQTVTLQLLNGPTINSITNNPNSTICASGSINIDVVATQGAVPSGPIQTYTWNPTIGLSPSAGANVVSTPSASTQYTVTVTDANGCSATSTTSVSFSPFFQIGTNANPSSIGLCGGTSILKVNDTVTGNTVLPTGYCTTSPINATFEDIVGFNFLSINNTTTPASGNLGCGTGVLGKYSDFTSCIPAPTIVSNTAYPFSLNLGTTGSGASNGSKIFIDFNRDGDFIDAGEQVYVTGVVTNGNHTEVGNIVVPPNITPGLTRLRISYYATSAANIPTISPCATTFSTGEVEDYAVNLISVPTLPIVSYSWTDTSATSTLSSTTGATVTASPLTNTTYTVTATNSLGCTATSTVSVTLGGISCSAITASSTVICVGQNSTLTANANLGGTPYTYQWYGTGATLGVDTNQNFTVSPSITSVYTVIVKDVCNSTCSSTIAITVNSIPDITITKTIPASNAICVTGFDTLFATSTAVPNITNIIWAPGSTLNVPNNDTVVSSPLINTTYTATLTDANGCTNTATVTVKISPAYNVNVSATSLYSSGCIADTLMADTLGNIVTTAINTQTGTGYTGAGNIGGVTFVVQNNTGNTIYLTSLSNFINTGGLGNFNLYKTTLSSNLSGLAGNISTNSSWSLIASNTNLNVTSSTQNVLFSNTNGFDSIPNGGIVRYYLESPNISIGGSSTGTPNIFTSSNINLLVGNFNISSLPVGVSGIITNVNSTTNRFFTGTITFKHNQLVYPITNYSWSSTPVTTYNILMLDTSKISATVTATTVFTVTATNSVGCTSTKSLTITSLPLNVDTLITDTLVCQNSNDTMKVKVSGGGQPYSFTISPNTYSQLNDSIFVLNIGTALSTVFTVTVTDVCGTTATKTATINTLNSPTISITSNNLVGSNCMPTTDTLTVNCATCSGYSWYPNPILPNDTSSTIYITPSITTTYTVVGTDVSGCTNFATYTMSMALPHNLTVTGSKNFMCYGDTMSLHVSDTVILNGSQILPTGYCASMPTGTSGQEITNVVFSSINNNTAPATGSLGCGTGTLSRYTDFTSCIATPTLQTGNSYPFSVNIGLTGTASLNAVKIFIDYNRDGDFIDSNETVFTSVSSTNGAHAETGNIVIPFNALNGVTRMRISNFNTGVPTNISSCGANGTSTNGEVEDYIINIITVSTASGMTYTWQDSSSFISNTGSQVYANALYTSSTFTVTATDANGCTNTKTYEVTVNPMLISTVSNNNITCNGYSDGNASVAVTGGIAPYTYSWTSANIIGSINNDSIMNVAAGVYYIQITDSNLCTAFDTVTITQPNAIDVTISNTNALCYGVGSASAYVSSTTGGTAPYTYIWFSDFTSSTQWLDVSANSDTAYNLLGDSCYYLFVQDSNNCFLDINLYPNLYSTICITQPSGPLVIDSIVVNNVLCYGGTSGSVSVYASGGAGSYQYALNTGAYSIANTFSGLIAGVYTVNIMDANGCTTTQTFTITEPTALIATITNIGNLSCNGSNNGFAVVSTTGGFASYSYSWNTVPVQTTDSVFALNSGIYTASVTDASGCTASATVAITEPIALSLSVDSITQILCNGESTGQATVSVTGGINPYTYFWTNGDTTSIISNLPTGAYTLIATDANACTISTVVALTEPLALNIVSNDSNVSCYGFSNGGITLIVSGGISSYNYLWSNGDTTNSITNLVVGSYSVIVKDANNCTKTYSTTITQPAQITVVVNSNNSSPVTGDTVSVFVSTSIPNTNYLWTGPSSFSNNNDTITFDNVTSNLNGVYTVVVTDTSNSCTNSAVYNLLILPRVNLVAKAFLSGPYSTTTGLMTDVLRTLNYIPIVEPYSTLSPYTSYFTHVNGGGGETVASSVYSVSGNNAIVDWVFLELRNKNNSSNVLATKAALLQRDGDIVSAVDNVSPVLFKNSPVDSYYVSVRHRNHLGVMTKAPILLSETSGLIDFTSTSTALYRRSAPFNNSFAYAATQDSCTRRFGTVLALYGGNANVITTGGFHKIVKYNGINNDKLALLFAGATASTPGYRVTDLNFDGVTKNNGIGNDRLVILQNVGANVNNQVFEQLPN